MRVSVSFGAANTITKDVPEGSTIGEIVTREVKAALGCGDGVQVLINRRISPSDCRIWQPTELVLETVANRKAANISVTISYGPANSLQKEVPDGTTVGQLLNDPNIRASLDYPQNVRALIGGVAQSSDCPLGDGDHIVVETLANSKA